MTISTILLKATLTGLIVTMLVLSFEVPYRSLAFASDSILVPATIHFEGVLESGSVEEGAFLITSGTVTFGDLSFQVSTSPAEWYNGSLNYMTTISGKLYSEGISLGNNYAMELAARFIPLLVPTLCAWFSAMENLIRV